ncbi:MAG: sensor histidine kinase [Bacteroidota bacterium]
MRDRWRNSSLGSRLTALSVGLLAALLGTLGSVLYLNLRRFLLDSTALRMRAQAKPVIERRFARSQPGDLERTAPAFSRSLTSRDTTASLFDRQGRYLADGRRLPEEPQAARPRPDLLRRALHGEKEITYTTTGEVRRSLVALIPLKPDAASDRIIGAIQLTTPLSQVDQILARQRWMLGLGMALTLGLGVIGERWLTRTSLQPLKRVIETIREIAAGDFSRRVQLPHTEDEVGQLAEAFDQMAGNIQTTFDSQSRFVSAAAHELRTPLTALSGSIDVLQRGAQDDPAVMRSLLQGMQREVKRLNHLTEDLLSLTRLDEPKALRLKQIRLEGFLKEILGKAIHLAGGRGLRLTPGPDVSMTADPDLLTQVLFNLIDNAVQHTGPQGTIEVDWKQDGHAVVLRVQDDGEGIAPEDLPHIFETFYRGDRSRSRRQGGTGLGLAIVRAIVQAHAGRIEVTSRPGLGTQFLITLPLDQPAGSSLPGVVAPSETDLKQVINHGLARNP